MNALTSPTIKVEVTNARGPRGFASGPLGAGSVDASTITADPAERQLIRDAIRAAPTVGTGALFIDGATAVGAGQARTDFQTGRRAPVSGTPGQRHALDFSYQPNTDDEIAFTGSMPVAGADRQIFSMFTALEAHRTTASSWCAYTGFHGESYRGDYNPATLYYDNRVEVCGGPVGGKTFDLGLTAVDFFHNFQKSYLQGAVIIGEHAQATRTGQIMEVNGTAFVGTVDATTKMSTEGLVLAWHQPSTQSLLQSFSHATGTFQFMTINAAETRFGQGNVVPASNATIDLGKSGGAWRNVFTANAVTVTSDARLKRVRRDGTPSDEERAWARSIRFVAYQMLDAIEEKGVRTARLHWGVLAQEVAEAGIAAGIADPYRYAFLTRDPLFETQTWLEEIEEQDIETVEAEEAAVEMRDGRAVMVKKKVKREQPKSRSVQLHDAAGKPLTREVPDPRGPYRNGTARKPITEAVMVEVPVMRKVQIEHSKQVPVMLENGEQDVRYGVRYEALFAFLLACGVFETAA